jgi:hypothetical protein
MLCENTGLTVGLKLPVRARKIASLRRDRRTLRSQNVFLNFAGRSLVAESAARFLRILLRCVTD